MEGVDSEYVWAQLELMKSAQAEPLFQIAVFIGVWTVIEAIAWVQKTDWLQMRFIPWASAVIMGLSSFYLWWNAEFSSHWTSMKEPIDGWAAMLQHYTLAYMIMDMTVLIFKSQLPMRARLEYMFHHFLMISNMVLSLMHGGRWGRLWLFGITSEITNIFLNFKELVGKDYKIYVDAVFALGFMTYRMGYMFKVLSTSLFYAFLDSPYDFFVILHGPALLVPLHFVWTFLIVKKVLRLVKSGGKKEKAL